jgi:hypothetical protein
MYSGYAGIESRTARASLALSPFIVFGFPIGSQI